jgi:diacylglycerol O-acyltransferase / wax synthase
VASRVGRAAGSVSALAWTGLRAAPTSIFNVRIGPHRRFTWVEADLGQFKSIKNSLGGTVNDVVLAAVTGALGSYMRLHGQPTENVGLRAMVPVSVRADIERGALGNRVAAMWVTLPVGTTDPEERLHSISATMDAVKQSGQAVGAEILTHLSGFAPPTIMAQAARLQARQRLFNLVVTNVPGPQFPLYLLGRELESVYPMVPLAENTALGIAILSYNGQLNFGLVADYDALADVEVLADELRSSIEELSVIAGAPAPATPPRAGATRANRDRRAPAAR